MIGPSATLELLTWRRDGTHDDPMDYPPLGRDEWRAFAGRIYHQAVTLSKDVPFPKKDNPTFEFAWTVNQAHRDVHSTRVRLLVGALFYRALQLGWRDIAARWHDRYWQLTDRLDDEEQLLSMAKEVATLENIERVPGLFL